ncbi:MAG TPA: hypothetical protein VFQ78_05255 [Candidatus Udaeobacter sp.]|jgi:hypothetical protein|nr:hypothetical protein [Candidatus Udaeobacter sp.]
MIVYDLAIPSQEKSVGKVRTGEDRIWLAFSDVSDAYDLCGPGASITASVLFRKPLSRTLPVPRISATKLNFLYTRLVMCGASHEFGAV